MFSTDGAASLQPVLQAEAITKRFGAIVALQGVDLSVYPNEVLGLVGDNGAGKSTLINILSGVFAPSSGRILLEGNEVAFDSPADARATGIETVYQEFALALNLSVASNIFMGREPTRRGLLRLLYWVDRKAMEREAASELEHLGIRLGSLRQRCGQLSGGQRQAVAITRAVAWGSRVILMDEPTAALGVEQQQRVLEMVSEIKARGLSTVFISHNIEQVHEVCDRVVVLRHGRSVADLRTSEADAQTIVMWITGALTAARDL